jgi:colicin import membrane protein
MAEAVAMTSRAGVKVNDGRADYVRAEREAELLRMLATEEEARARSGVVDEYRVQLIQAVERNWIRPPSARGGVECTVYVRQTPGGDVEDIRVGQCNGDQAVRDSIVHAVLNSVPLPLPSDPRAFQRRLEIVFKSGPSSWFGRREKP